MLAVADPLPRRTVATVPDVINAASRTLVPLTVILAPLSRTSLEKVCMPDHVGAMDRSSEGAASERMAVTATPSIAVSPTLAEGFARPVIPPATLPQVSSPRQNVVAPSAGTAVEMRDRKIAGYPICEVD